MSDLYDKIVSQRGSLESLISKIPGFRGYMEMSGRREADRLIRDHLKVAFNGLVNRLVSIESDMVNQGGLLYMDRTKSIKTRLQNLQTRIATDTPGYSGFFAANKIGPDELEKIYAFDEAMGRYVDEIAIRLDSLTTAVAAGGAEIPTALSNLDAIILEAHQAYDLRETVLTDLGS